MIFDYILSDIIGLHKKEIRRLIAIFIYMEKTNIYIGKIIAQVMAEKQITKAELARRLNIRPQSVDYMLTRKSIDTDTLYNVSCALEHDFALLYSIGGKQTNLDKPVRTPEVTKAKITVELELDKEDLLRLNLKKKINTLFEE